MRVALWIASCLAAALLAQPAAAQQADGAAETTWTLDQVLKKSDKALKGVRFLQAEIRYAEIVNDRPINGEGTLSVSLDGRVRADIRGDRPRTFIAQASYLYIHKPEEQVVEIYEMSKVPNMLVQYALLGFAPAGSAMKKGFAIEIVGNDAVNGREAVQLQLRPKSKEIRTGLARIDLWLDTESWKPLRQEIYHATATTHLSVRYLDIEILDKLPDSLFSPSWPAGTKQVVR